MSEAPANGSSSEEAYDETPKIFINYRRSETQAWAVLLHRDLADRFGEENVFLDLHSIKPGTKWLEEIQSQGKVCTAFIALIGPRWASIMRERARSSEEDQVRAEIEAALKKDSAVRMIVPALVDDARQPSEDDLPTRKSLWPLLKWQWQELRPKPREWSADVQELSRRLEEPTEKQPTKPPPPPPPPPPPDPREPPDPPDRMAPRPDHAHYEELVRLMVEDGSVVPVLGPGANSSDRSEPWRGFESGFLPDAKELAAYLAQQLEQRLGEATEAGDLAQASQHVSVARGQGDLYRVLKRALPSHYPPSSVHEFLADLPNAQRSPAGRSGCQLIVTTNYDQALEQALDARDEPYDLAVYMAEEGKFAHVPFDGEPALVTDANEYAGFPLEEFGEVTRTVILKIHGAIDDPRRRNPWENNYVITEDDYIDYMSGGDISSIVPQQLLAKLRESHFLFLGYTMRDWSLRVFLMRIFGHRQQLPNHSWAIQHEPDRLDSRFWRRIGVDLFALPLDRYVRELRDELAEAGVPREA